MKSTVIKTDITSVAPAQTGVHFLWVEEMDSRLRGNDDLGEVK